jgi:AcrR family transcriptional regulator
MERARAGILKAAAQLVAEQGLHSVTMAGVARRAGVAKATVYNHVRDRDELIAQLLADQWSRLQQVCADQPRDQRLSAAATWVSDSAVLAGLRRHNPEAIVTLGELSMTDPEVLAAVGTWIPEGRDSDAALRWLISFAIAPHQSTPET